MRKRTQENAKNKNSGNTWQRALDFKDADVKFFKPKKGKNLIDIIPYIVSTKNHPQGVEKGYDDYVLDVFVHNKVGPKEGAFLCPKKNFGKPCPICEEQDSLRKSGDADDDEIKALSPKRRVFYNIIDLKDEDAGVQIWEVSHYLFEKELLEEAESSDEEFIAFADLEEGKSIKFRAAEVSQGGYTYMEYKSFDFIDRDEYDEDILEETTSLDKYMVICTYQEILAAFHGVEEADEEDDDDEDEEEEAPKSKRSRKKPAKDEDDDEDDDEEDDDEEEAPKRKKTPGKSSKKDKHELGKAESKKNKKSKKEYPECPEGFKYGHDCDDYDECSDCDLWDKCADAKDELDG